MNAQSRTTPPRRYLFGPFEFDDESGDLRKHGSRVRLQGQPLQILCAVIRRPGAIVSRDELQRELWPAHTFVDFDHGLNAAINRLRQVLGDSADQPRYVETLPGRGYRFIAAVQEIPSTPILVVSGAPPGAESESQRAATETSGRAKKKVLHLSAAAAAVIVSLAGVYLAGGRGSTTSVSQPVQFGILPPDGYALEAGSSRQTFALSPDGTRLAFTAMDASGVFQMFVRDLDGLESRPLPNGKGAYTVFWAPDGKSVFLTITGSLRRSPLTGDSYQVICDSPTTTLMGALLGETLLISGRSANFLVPISGGTPTAIKELYQWPQLMPDGKHIVYTVFDAKLGRHRARVVKFGEPATARDLLETDSRVMYAPSVLNSGTGYLFFVRAGNLLAQPFDPRSLQVAGEPLAIVSRVYSFLPTGAADFSVSNNGMLAYKRYVSRSQLAWVNRRGEVQSTIGPANVNLKQARVSPDGKEIATPIFDVNRGVNDMWIIDARTGAARRAIPGPGFVDNPVWSPDSGTLAFNRVYDSPPKLFLRGLGDQDADEPLPADYFQIPRDWSRDGRFLAFTNTGFAQIQSELNGDVRLIDMARGRKVINLIGTVFHEDNPAFSPDGRWLAFTSNESGRSEVYLQAFEADGRPRVVGPRHLVSQHGALALRWRRDGRELFYLAWDGKVYAVPIALSPKLKISEPVPLFSIGTEARAALHSLVGFDVSTDGQRLLIPVTTSAERSEIVVIQNWEAGFQP